MNNVQLIGRLTKNPELTYTGTQIAVCHFSLAIDRPISQGKEKQTDFIRITVFGKQAENCDRFLQQGRQAGITGRIQTGNYKDKDGKTVYTTDVIADRVEFLGGRQDSDNNGGNQNHGNNNQGYNNQNQQGGYNNSYNNNSQTTFGDMDIPDSFQDAEDDIPF